MTIQERKMIIQEINMAIQEMKMAILEGKMASGGYPSPSISFLADVPSTHRVVNKFFAGALIGKFGEKASFTVSPVVCQAGARFWKVPLSMFGEKASFTVSPAVCRAGAGVQKVPLSMDCLYNYQTPMLGRPLKKPVLCLTSMINKLRDGNDPIQMHENFGTHDGHFQEGEGGPEDTGFVHDMGFDGVADDPMQIDAVEDYPNFSAENVAVWFNQNLMGLIDTTGIDSPDQLKGAAILIAHLPAGQYIFKYVRYEQEIRMDNDDFRHFLEDLTGIHIWDGELVTVS